MRRDPRPGMKTQPSNLITSLLFSSLSRESKSNPSLPSGSLPFFVLHAQKITAHRRYKSRSPYITFPSPSPFRPSHTFPLMQQYHLRPVSELSRSPSSRSSGSPPNHHLSPPSSHLPPIQHPPNPAQAPPRRPISPSSLPRMSLSSSPLDLCFYLQEVLPTLRPRCF